MDPVSTHAKTMVKLEKHNSGGRKEDFANFKPSQKEFVGGGKVARESRLEEKKRRKWTRNMGIWSHIRWTVGMISVHLSQVT